MILLQTNGRTANVTITDAIYSGFYADLKKVLLEAGEYDSIEIELCSEGGVLTEAFACYNFLKAIPQKVTVTVNGWAASAATYLLMAADEIRMYENSFLMIHEPSLFLFEDVNLQEAEKISAVLTSMRDTIVQAYQTKTGLDAATLATYMREETWLSAAEAQELRFCDGISGTALYTAKMENIPEKIKEKIMAAKTKKTVMDQENLEKDVKKEEILPAAEDTKQEVKEDPQPAAEGEEKEEDPLEVLEAKVKALEEENEALKKENSDLKAEKETAETELAEVKNRVERMTAGVKKEAVPCNEGKTVKTWKEAMADCKGDYLLARKKYADIFAEMMNANR